MTPAPLTPEERRLARLTAEKFAAAKPGMVSAGERGLALSVLRFDAALKAVEQERDSAQESFDVVAARMIGAEREVVRLKAQLAEADDLTRQVVGALRSALLSGEPYSGRLETITEAWLASVSGADATEELALPPLDVAAALWVAAIDCKPIEEREAWVEKIKRQIADIDASRAGVSE